MRKSRFFNTWKYILLFIQVVMLSAVEPLSAQMKKVELGDDIRLTGQIESPNFAPVSPMIVAYERREKDVQELYLVNIQTKRISKVTAQANEKSAASEDFSFLLNDQPNIKLSRYEGQLEWRPVLDSRGRQWFAFISSGANRDYDIYLSWVDEYGALSSEPALQLPHSGTDHYPRWSPDGQVLLFVSEGATGMDLYMCDNIGKILKNNSAEFYNPRKITANPYDDNFPAWSPDGQYISYQSVQKDNNILNLGINLIHFKDLSSNEYPPSIRLTTELYQYNEYKPSWSPDGRYIAFYVDHSRMDETGDDQLQDIAIAGINPNFRTGRIEGGTVLTGYSKRFAENVHPKNNAGPTWVNFSIKKDILYIAYVKKDEAEQNPIYVREFAPWINKQKGVHQSLFEKLDVKINRHVNFALRPAGAVFAFASQEGDAYRLQVVNLNVENLHNDLSIPMEKERQAALVRSIIPGLGQWYKGQKTKAVLVASSQAATLILLGIISNNTNISYDDCQSYRQAYDNGASADEISANYASWQKSYDEWNSNKNLTTGLGLLALGIWIYNVVDCYTGFPLIVNQPVKVSHVPLEISRPSMYLSYHENVPTLWLSTNIHF